MLSLFLDINRLSKALYFLCLIFLSIFLTIHFGLSLIINHLPFSKGWPALILPSLVLSHLSLTPCLILI